MKIMWRADCIKVLTLLLTLVNCQDDDWKDFARPAPFCVEKSDSGLKRFSRIMDHHNKLAEESRYLIHVATTPNIPDHEVVDWVWTNAPIDDESGNEQNMLLPIHKPPYEHKFKFLTVTFTRMNPFSVDPTSQVFNLRQWMHIHISSTKPLKGLYVQSISGPLGVPFGEFSNAFGCNDCKMQGNSKYNYKSLEMEIIPCAYRPFHSLKHPNVVVVGGRKEVHPDLHDVHFHFNWAEGLCQSKPLMQFFIIAVTDFDQVELGHHPFYTQVINNTIPDSFDMTAYPYYPDFEKNMMCHGHLNELDKTWNIKRQINYDILKARPYKTLHVRLLYNKDFDDCVKNGGKGGDGKNQCPPSTLRCTKVDGRNLKYRLYNDTIRKRKILLKHPQDTEDDDFVEKVCPECRDFKALHNVPPEFEFDFLVNHPPPHWGWEWVPLENDLGPGPSNVTGSQDSEIENELRFYEMEVKDMIRNVHSKLMIFAFVTCPIISNFVARFFKETGHLDEGFQVSTVGLWLWTHIGLSYLSLASMWGGIGIIIFYPSECLKNTNGDILECVGSPHKVGGIIAMCLFHMNFLTGWCRPLGPRLRTLYIWWHVLFGYGCQILAGFAILYMSFTSPLNLTLAVVIAWCASGICYIPMTVLQRYADKDMKLVVPRQLLPVPEAINVPPAMPFATVRYTILIIFLISQISLYIWVIVS